MNGMFVLYFCLTDGKKVLRGYSVCKCRSDIRGGKLSICSDISLTALARSGSVRYIDIQCSYTDLHDIAP